MSAVSPLFAIGSILGVLGGVILGLMVGEALATGRWPRNPTLIAFILLSVACLLWLIDIIQGTFPKLP